MTASRKKRPTRVNDSSNVLVWRGLHQRAMRVDCKKCGALAGNSCISVRQDRAGHRKKLKQPYSHPLRIHHEYLSHLRAVDEATV